MIKTMRNNSIGGSFFLLKALFRANPLELNMTEAAKKCHTKIFAKCNLARLADPQVPGDFEGNSWVMPHDIFMEVLTGFILCVLQLSLATLGLQVGEFLHHTWCLPCADDGSVRKWGRPNQWQCSYVLMQNMMINTMIFGDLGVPSF